MPAGSRGSPPFRFRRGPGGATWFRFFGFTLLCATGIHAQPGFRAWVGLFDSAHLGWLENESRLGELCTEPATLAECYSKHLAPRVSIYPLHAESDHASDRIGDLIVTAVPGRRLCAHFREEGRQRTTSFTPDLFLQDWGYGPYFHQTVTARVGNWFQLPREPWEEEVWVYRAGEDEHASVIHVQPGDILEMGGSSWYVLAAELDALVLRTEQPADLWCEPGDPPALIPFEPIRFPREKLVDSDGRWVFRLKYLKGC